MTEKSAHEDVDTGKMVANSDNKSSPGMRAVMWGGGLASGDTYATCTAVTHDKNQSLAPASPNCLLIAFPLCCQVVALAMDGESEPNPVIAEEAGERVEPMDATPSPQQQTTPPPEEAGEAVSMVTEDGATKEGGTEDNDDDVVLVEEEAVPQPSATTLSQDTPSTDCLEPDAAVETVDMSTATMPSKTPSSPASSSTSQAAEPLKPPTTAAEPIVIDDEEDSEQKDTSSSSPAHPGGASASPGVLSSTEPDSEIRIASVTTLGSSSQKGNTTISAANTPPHSADAQEDMNLMITSVTSLQGGVAAVTAVRISRTVFYLDLSQHAVLSVFFYIGVGGESIFHLVIGFRKSLFS